MQTVAKMNYVHWDVNAGGVIFFLPLTALSWTREGDRYEMCGVEA